MLEVLGRAIDIKQDIIPYSNNIIKICFKGLDFLELPSILI